MVSVMAGISILFLLPSLALTRALHMSCFE